MLKGLMVKIMFSLSVMSHPAAMKFDPSWDTLDVHSTWPALSVSDPTTQRGPTEWWQSNSKGWLIICRARRWLLESGPGNTWQLHRVDSDHDLKNTVVEEDAVSDSPRGLTQNLVFSLLEISSCSLWQKIQPQLQITIHIFWILKIRERACNPGSSSVNLSASIFFFFFWSETVMENWLHPPNPHTYTPPGWQCRWV